MIGCRRVVAKRHGVSLIFRLILSLIFRLILSLIFRLILSLIFRLILSLIIRLILSLIFRVILSRVAGSRLASCAAIVPPATARPCRCHARLRHRRPVAVSCAVCMRARPLDLVEAAKAALTRRPRRRRTALL